MPCEVEKFAKYLIDNKINTKLTNSIQELVDNNQLVLGSEEIVTQLGDRGPDNEISYWSIKQRVADEVQRIQDEYVGTDKTLRIEGRGDYRVASVFQRGMSIVIVPTKGEYKEIVLPLGSELKDTQVELDPDNLKRGALRSNEGIKRVLAQLVEMSNVSPKYVEYYNNIINNINPEFIPKLKLYVDTEANKNFGQLQMGKSAIAVEAKRGITYNNEMTAAEVYVHELIHAITAYAITESDKHPESYKIVRQIEHMRDRASKLIKWQDLLPEQSLDAAKEEETAKKRWKYMFESKNGLHEFIAHGVTNPRVVEKLRAIPMEEKTEYKTLLDKVLGLFQKLVDWATGTMNNPSKYQHEALLQLTFDLMEFNNKAVNKTEREAKTESKVLRLIEKGNIKIANAIKYFEDKAEEGSIEPPPVNGTKWEYSKWMARWIHKLVLRKDQKGMRELVMYVFGAKPEGMLRNILRDMSNPDELEREIEFLAMQSNNIDRARGLTTDQTRKMINLEFNKELTSTEKEAITLVLLDTDVESLGMRGTKLAELLEDSKKLGVEIEKMKNIVGRLDRDNANWNIIQAKGLGYYLATHKAGIAQNLSANNIAAGVLSGRRRVPDPELVKAIDKLATLEGLKHTPKEAKDLVAKLVRKEKKGVGYVLDLHKGIKQRSKDKLFNTDVHMIKGYTKEIFDDTIGIAVRTVADEEVMKREGYTLVKVLSKSKTDGSTEPMAVYRSKYMASNTYNRHAMRLTDRKGRGTTLTDIGYAGNTELAKKRAKLDKRRMDRVLAKTAKAMQEGKYDPTAVEDWVTPVLDTHGNVIDYRYMASKENKKEWLHQDTSMDEVLGKTLASIDDKLKTEDVNNAVLDIILDDMKKNYIEGESRGKNQQFYMKIEENSPNETVREIYRILPHNIKTAIKMSDKGYIAVRRDMLHYYFGFRETSLTDMEWIDKHFPGAVKQAIKFAEHIWKELVKISKVDIVIRTPIVLIENIISNFMYSVIAGRNPIIVFKKSIDNTRYMRDYLNKVELIDRMIIDETKTGKKNPKIKMLQEELKNNPLHELMEEGMYQAVIEDVSRQDFKSSNRLARSMDEKMAGMPSFIKDGAHWLFLSEKTPVFKFMTIATQYSDFVARATEYQLLLEKGVSKTKAKRVILDAFVNYNKPASSFEEYLNSMGFIMFTKYAKRIQRSIFKNIREKPLNIFLSAGMQEMLGDVSDIYDQSLLVRNYSMLGVHPFDHVKRAITPSALEAVGAL